MRQTVTKTSEGQMGLGNALRWVWKMEDLGLGSVPAELGLSVPRGPSSQEGRVLCGDCRCRLLPLRSIQTGENDAKWHARDAISP